MPIYEYKCYNCDHEFEAVQKITEDSISKCPNCEKDGKVKRLISSTSFHLKGNGWYKTDYTGSKKKEEKSETKNVKKEPTEGN